MDDFKAVILVNDKELRQTLTALDTLKKFTVTSIMPGQKKKLQEILKNSDLVLMEVSAETDALLSDFAPGNDSCFVFLSEGLPLKNLDSLMEKGAGYHFRAPFDLDAIDQAVKAFYHRLYIPEDDITQSQSSHLDQFGLLVGSSEPMRQLFQVIHKLAPTEGSVFISGESGVGKELVAQTIHVMSQRNGEPFVAINCGAINKELAESDFFGHRKGAFSGASEHRPGVFERADKGTLFLDEITEMPLETQVKLLRVLETGKMTPVGAKESLSVDVRIISACNRDPHQAIKDGFLREDLYYRLAQFNLNVTPLRERGSDVIGLAQHFLSYLNAQNNTDIRLTESAVERLITYSWPGNVRELKSVIERSYLLNRSVITADGLYFEQVTGDSASNGIDVPACIPLDVIEKKAIENTLKCNNGNKTKTAQQLNISLKTLYNKLKKYGLSYSRI